MSNLSKTEAEKLLNEIYGLLLPYRKRAKEVNFGSASKKDAMDVLEIVGKEFTIKVQVIER
jgi:hypothetical protein